MRTTIIHNETCPICAREVRHYGKAARAAGTTLDIQGLDGTARLEFDLTREDAARRFHVVQNGELFSGIAAFIIVWDTLPRFRWLAKLFRNRLVRTVATPVYDYILAPALYALHKRRERF